MLTSILGFLTNLRRQDKGATMVEYGLMVGLIAVVVMVVVEILGGQISALFCSGVTALGGSC